MADYQIIEVTEIQGRPIVPYYRVGVFRCDAYTEAVLLRELLNSATDEQKDRAYTVMLREMERDDDRAA